MTPVTEGPPLLLRSGVWRQRRCFPWRLGLERWSFTPELLLTPGCERGHELRTRGKDRGKPILWIMPKWSWRSCQPEQLLGDSSILHQLATLLRAWRGWGKCPESLHGLHPTPNQSSLHSHLGHLPTIPSCHMRMRPTELYLTHFYSTTVGGEVGGLQRASGILKAEQAHFIFLWKK